MTGKEIDVWYLTSENVTDMNTLAEPDKITVQKTTVNGSGTSINYVLQPHSVYSFKIPAEKTTVTVTAGENGAASGGKENAAPGEEIMMNWYHQRENIRFVCQKKELRLRQDSAVR